MPPRRTGRTAGSASDPASSESSALTSRTSASSKAKKAGKGPTQYVPAPTSLRIYPYSATNMIQTLGYCAGIYAACDQGARTRTPAEKSRDARRALIRLNVGVDKSRRFDFVAETFAKTYRSGIKHGLELSRDHAWATISAIAKKDPAAFDQWLRGWLPWDLLGVATMLVPESWFLVGQVMTPESWITEPIFRVWGKFFEPELKSPRDLQAFQLRGRLFFGECLLRCLIKVMSTDAHGYPQAAPPAGGYQYHRYFLTEKVEGQRRTMEARHRPVYESITTIERLVDEAYKHADRGFPLPPHLPTLTQTQAASALNNQTLVKAFEDDTLNETRRKMVNARRTHASPPPGPHTPPSSDSDSGFPWVDVEPLIGSKDNWFQYVRTAGRTPLPLLPPPAYPIDEPLIEELHDGVQQRRIEYVPAQPGEGTSDTGRSGPSPPSSPRVSSPVGSSSLAEEVGPGESGDGYEPGYEGGDEDEGGSNAVASPPRTRAYAPHPSSDDAVPVGSDAFKGAGPAESVEAHPPSSDLMHDAKLNLTFSLTDVYGDGWCALHAVSGRGVVGRDDQQEAYAWAVAEGARVTQALIQAIQDVDAGRESRFNTDGIDLSLALDEFSRDGWLTSNSLKVYAIYCNVSIVIFFDEETYEPMIIPAPNVDTRRTSYIFQRVSGEHFMIAELVRQPGESALTAEELQAGTRSTAEEYDRERRAFVDAQNQARKEKEKEKELAREQTADEGEREGGAALSRVEDIEAADSPPPSPAPGMSSDRDVSMASPASSIRSSAMLDAGSDARERASSPMSIASSEPIRDARPLMPPVPMYSTSDQPRSAQPSCLHRVPVVVAGPAPGPDSDPAVDREGSSDSETDMRPIEFEMIAKLECQTLGTSPNLIARLIVDAVNGANEIFDARDKEVGVTSLIKFLTRYIASGKPLLDDPEARCQQEVALLDKYRRTMTDIKVLEAELDRQGIKYGPSYNDYRTRDLRQTNTIQSLQAVCELFAYQAHARKRPSEVAASPWLRRKGASAACLMVASARKVKSTDSSKRQVRAVRAELEKDFTSDGERRGLSPAPPIGGSQKLARAIERCDELQKMVREFVRPLKDPVTRQTTPDQATRPSSSAHRGIKTTAAPMSEGKRKLLQRKPTGPNGPVDGWEPHDLRFTDDEDDRRRRRKTRTVESNPAHRPSHRRMNKILGLPDTADNALQPRTSVFRLSRREVRMMQPSRSVTDPDGDNCYSDELPSEYYYSDDEDKERTEKRALSPVPFALSTSSSSDPFRPTGRPSSPSDTRRGHARGGLADPIKNADDSRAWAEDTAFGSDWTPKEYAYDPSWLEADRRWEEHQRQQLQQRQQRRQQQQREQRVPTGSRASAQTPRLDRPDRR